MKPISIFTLFIVLLCNILDAQENNPYQYLDDGGISSRKNAVFTDLTYLHKPYFVFGYQRILNQSFSVEGEIILLQKDKFYTIPQTVFYFNSHNKFLKADSKLNFSISATYHHTPRKPNLRHYISIGYQLVHFSNLNINDVFVRKSIIAFEFKNRLMASFNIVAGARFGNFLTTYSPKPGYLSIDSFIDTYIHAPIIVGIRF